VVDGFTVVDRLGQGGMGAVYLVEQASTGGRFALKTLAYPDPELVLRFQREAEAQARVDGHPNVARIHSAASVNGQAYYVMDLAAGGDLQARLREGPLPPRRAATIVRDLARGLAHVHAHGILHRDLKPQNVLFDEHDTPKLVDFGLAKLLDARSLTQTGDILGTPAYMPPEQADGRREAIGPPSDVYGLGGILYACLTGEPPFQAQSNMALLRLVLDQSPLPPSSYRPVPRPLETIVLKCLAKRPVDRYPSASALAEALDAWLAGEAESPRRGLKSTLALAVVGILLGAAIMAGPPASSDRPPPAPSPPPASVASTTAPSPSPSPSATPTPTPTPPALPALSDAERFAALLDAIGLPAADPPSHLPASYRESWELSLKWPDIGHATAIQLKRESDALRAAGDVEAAEGLLLTARQILVQAAHAGLGRAWVELGKTYPGPNQPDFDPFPIFECYRAGLELGCAAAAERLGGLFAHQAWSDPLAYEVAAAYYRRGLELPEDELGSRARCAESLADMVFRAGGPPFSPVSAAEGIRLLDDLLLSTTTARPLAHLLLAKLLRLVDEPYRAGQVRVHLERAALAPGVLGDRAVAELARLLREGWGRVAADPPAAAALLAERVADIERSPRTSYDWAPPLRLKYELACSLTEWTEPGVPKDVHRAAALWGQLKDEGHERGWLYLASLRQLSDLREAEDEALRQQAAEAHALLRAEADDASRSEHFRGTARWFLRELERD
jgi:serine/threonine protein kinase